MRKVKVKKWTRRLITAITLGNIAFVGFHIATQDWGMLPISGIGVACGFYLMIASEE